MAITKVLFSALLDIVVPGSCHDFSIEVEPQLNINREMHPKIINFFIVVINFNFSKILIFNHIC
jgi:hypothetical protein